jgi:hypothetical protein
MTNEQTAPHPLTHTLFSSLTCSEDNYMIPLTKKLRECGVFGVSSDEYLNYATDNRREWEAKGFEIVNSLVEKCKSMDLQYVPAEVGYFNLAVASKVRVKLPRVPIPDTPVHKDFRAKQA